MISLYQQALTIAVAAHKEQVRKTDGSPYVVHPIMVAKIVETYGFREEVVAAALVHDVLEDTSVTEAELRAELGDVIVNIVTAVSEDKEKDWKARKVEYIEQVVAADEATKVVSVADKIHNAQSLIHFHTKIGNAAWDVFSKPRAEKLWFERSLLKALQAVWQHPLLKEYEQLVIKMEALN